MSYTENIRQLADKHGLKVHLDGARIFNAAVALKVTPSALAKHADSIQCCFTKGLAAPMGAMISGDKKFIAEAVRVRQALGGGTRQAGIVAAACEVALDKMIDRLADDHKTARLFAKQLADLPGILIEPEQVKTNIVFFDIDLPGISQAQFVELLQTKKILMFNERGKFRAVTHYGIEENDIVDAIDRIKVILSDLKQTGRTLSPA